MKLTIRTVIVLALLLALAACHRAAPAQPAKPAPAAVTVTPSGSIGTALSIQGDKTALTTGVAGRYK